MKQVQESYFIGNRKHMKVCAYEKDNQVVLKFKKKRNF